MPTEQKVKLEIIMRTTGEEVVENTLTYHKTSLKTNIKVQRDLIAAIDGILEEQERA